MAVPKITIARVFQYLIERTAGRFYGEIVITFRDGAIVRMQPMQSFAQDSEIPIADESAVALMETGRYAAPATRSNRT